MLRRRSADKGSVAPRGRTAVVIPDNMWIRPAAQQGRHIYDVAFVIPNNILEIYHCIACVVSVFYDDII